MIEEVRSAPRRCVNLYVSRSRDRMIVAAMHQNFAGIYYEQSQPALINEWPDPETLGIAYLLAFKDFSVKDTNLRDKKRTDWPSYRASKLRSVREFERRFMRISCCGLNSSNAVVRASTLMPGNKDVELSVSFNPLLSEVVGKRLFNLIDAANALELNLGET